MRSVNWSFFALWTEKNWTLLKCDWRRGSIISWNKWETGTGSIVHCFVTLLMRMCPKVALTCLPDIICCYHIILVYRHGKMDLSNLYGGVEKVRPLLRWYSFFFSSPSLSSSLYCWSTLPESNRQKCPRWDGCMFVAACLTQSMVCNQKVCFSHWDIRMSLEVNKNQELNKIIIIKIIHRQSACRHSL